MVWRIAALDLVALRDVRRGHGTAVGNRPDATAPTRDRPSCSVKGLDVFHTKKEAHRVLSVLWSRVERLWERAEKASRALKRAQWLGRSACGLTHPVNKAWKKATLAFQLYERGKRLGSGSSQLWMSFVPTVNSTIGPWRKRNRVGFAPAARLGMVQGPWAPSERRVVHVLGSAARSVGSAIGARGYA